MVRMLMVLSLPGSRTAFEAERRKGKTAEDLGRLIDEPCDQTPTTWAVDYLFRGMEPSGLADIRTGMVRSLINARRLEDWRCPWPASSSRTASRNTTSRTAS